MHQYLSLAWLIFLQKIARKRDRSPKKSTLYVGKIRNQVENNVCNNTMNDPGPTGLLENCLRTFNFFYVRHVIIKSKYGYIYITNLSTFYILKQINIADYILWTFFMPTIQEIYLSRKQISFHRTSPLIQKTAKNASSSLRWIRSPIPLP